MNRRRFLTFFAAFNIPKRLQSKSGASNRFYSIYKIIASLMMTLHQPYSEILQMDIVDAMSFIQAATSLRSPKKKNPLKK